jgi:hypothetical protein
MAINGGGGKYPGIDLGPTSFRAAQRCGCDSSCRRPLWLCGRRLTGGKRIKGGGDSSLPDLRLSGREGGAMAG